MEDSGLQLNGKRGDGGRQFGNHIGELSRWMQREMARTGAGIKFGERRIIGLERSFRLVEFVYQQFVEREIVDEGEALVGGKVDGVGMCGFLALRIQAVAGVLDEGRRLAEL